MNFKYKIINVEFRPSGAGEYTDAIKPSEGVQSSFMWTLRPNIGFLDSCGSKIRFFLIKIMCLLMGQFPKNYPINWHMIVYLF